MNAKARALGRWTPRFVEFTGLSSNNQSSARDPSCAGERAAHGDPILREFFHSPGYEVAVVGSRTLRYSNTNRLVKSPSWDIASQKAGYISGGRTLPGDADANFRAQADQWCSWTLLENPASLGDAERVRNWVSPCPHCAPPCLKLQMRSAN